MADYNVVTCPLCDCTTRVERDSWSMAGFRRVFNQDSPPRCENCRLVMSDEAVAKAKKLEAYAYNENTKMAFVLLRKIKHLRGRGLAHDERERLDGWLDAMWRGDGNQNVSERLIELMLKYNVCYFDRNNELQFYDERGGAGGGNGGYDDGRQGRGGYSTGYDDRQCGGDYNGRRRDDDYDDRDYDDPNYDYDDPNYDYDNGGDGFWDYFMQRANELRGFADYAHCVEYDRLYDEANDTGDWAKFDRYVMNLMVNQYHMGYYDHNGDFQFYPQSPPPPPYSSRNEENYYDDLDFLDGFGCDFADAVVELSHCVTQRQNAKLNELYHRGSPEHFENYATNLMTNYYGIAEFVYDKNNHLTDELRFIHTRRGYRRGMQPDNIMDAILNELIYYVTCQENDRLTELSREQKRFLDYAIELAVKYGIIWVAKDGEIHII